MTPGRATTRSRGSAATREQLLRAAAELIGEVGWGRVTTRAVADRAGLPHGAVSYHFSSKQDLLIEAAVGTFEQAFPLSKFESLRSVDELLDLIAGALGNPKNIDPVLTGVSMEAMREAARDRRVRRRLASLMRDYRDVIATLVRSDQKRDAVPPRPPADGLATLIGALGDGLLLHALVDPKLDLRQAIDALRTLLRT